MSAGVIILRAMIKPGHITPQEAHAMLQRGDNVEIIDVRQPAEYRQVHVDPSRLIPLGELEKRAGELDRTRTLLTLCRSGSRSTMAAQLLAKAGYEVRNVDGGILRWIKEQLPVVEGS